MNLLRTNSRESFIKVHTNLVYISLCELLVNLEVQEVIPGENADLTICALQDESLVFKCCLQGEKDASLKVR